MNELSETAIKLYEHFKSNREYQYSFDSTIRTTESLAVDELESAGLIVVITRTIGYVVAEAF